MQYQAITIKMRLALLFTILVALILACFAWANYAFYAYQRSEVFFSDLKVNAVATATIVLRSDNLSDSVLEPYRKKVLNKLSQENIDIFNESRISVFHQGDKPMRLPDAVMRKTLLNGIYAYSDRETQYLLFPFQDEDKQYVVAISAVDEQGLNTMAKLRWGLFVGYITALMIVFAFGKWFAAEAIAPLANITSQAEKISATDLHVRLVPGTQKDELFNLTQAFNGMLDRLEKAFESQKQFIANASHELRTPLTTMEGLLEVAMMRNREEKEYRQSISIALEETKALRITTNNLLLLTRAEADLVIQGMRPLRLDETLLSALEEAKHRHPNRMVELEYTSIPEDERLLMINGNEDLLRNALLNLLENAFKYSPEDSLVYVSLNASHGNRRLRVRDKGMGISQEDMAHVFEPFFRSQMAQAIQGSGIGLTLVRSIVTRHHGSIKIESALGVGTTVEVDLPAPV